MLPARWNVTEEVYNFLTDPRAVGAKVLLSVDETTYIGEWPYNGIKHDANNRATDGNGPSTKDGTPHPIGKLVSFSTPLFQLTFVRQHGTKTNAPGRTPQPNL